MNTAQEILQRDRNIRLEREAKEIKREEFAKRWRTKGYGSWRAQIGSSVLMFCVAAVPLIGPSVHGDRDSIRMLSAALLVFSLMLHLAYQRRRRDLALFAIIEQEAPELFKKLQEEEIA